MDDFVCNKLREWGLSKHIQTFKDQEVNEFTFFLLDDEGIKELFPNVGSRTLFKYKLNVLKADTQGTAQTLTGPEQETVPSTLQVLPSTSSANETRKRTQEPQGTVPAVKRQRLQTASEKKALSDVKAIMGSIKVKVRSGQRTPFTDFLKKKIDDLETGKREQICILGRTGSGKSSLINAIIGEKDLLPSGSVSACTSVMFRLEANNASPKYEAEIEFIQKEEWEEELWLWENLPVEEEDAKTLKAVYGADWANQDLRKNGQIKQFLDSTKKIFKCNSAEEVSEELYECLGNPNEGGSRQYWPLVKCVTIKVPKQDLLQHVTLVDLPGNGDRNNSRDQMWKTVVGSCSTVWVVADIKRAVAEKEAWEILENAGSLLGNGGECEKIVFICTNSDNIGIPDKKSNFRDCVVKRNQHAKRQVMATFKNDIPFRRDFTDDCFEVFTVTSKEFFNEESEMSQDDTEIPKLCKTVLVQNVNASHSETLSYVTGAHGILSLIHGARQGKTGCNMSASNDLRANLDRKIKECDNKMKQTCGTFDQRLTEGVEKAKDQCEESVEKILNPRGVKGGAFHQSLRFAVQKNGVFKAKKGRKTKNINMELSSPLTESIDEDFKKTFPNQHQQGPFQGAIDSFSLCTEELMEKYRDVELQLSFLKTEEDNIKKRLKNTIQKRKKEIYHTPTKTMEETMKPCYEEAKLYKGEGLLEKLRSKIKAHVMNEKDMFQRAKDNTMEELLDLLDEIAKELRSLKESIDHSFQADAAALPDVSDQLTEVKKLKDQLEHCENPN